MFIEKFLFELTRSIANDTTLYNSLHEHVLDSYLNDLIRIFCNTLEKQFTEDHAQSAKAIDFVARWLRQIDEDDPRLLEAGGNRNSFLLAYAHTSFEYEKSDILSLYSACRIINRLDPTQTFLTSALKGTTSVRSSMREELFRRMFDALWKRLLQLCTNQNENRTSWIQNYVFVSKYYPSDKVLEQIQLVEIRKNLEFMNLAYVILLNEKISHPQELVSSLLNIINSNDHDGYINYETSYLLKMLPKIIETIHQHCVDKNENASTLMIDLQQWIVSLLKTNRQSCNDEISYLFKYLNQPSCQWPFSVKQFLFDQLVTLSVEISQLNISKENEVKSSFHDRLKFFSVIAEYFSADNVLKDYRLPYHPAVIDYDNRNERPILIDLFFFHIKRYAHEAIIDIKFIKKLMLQNMPIIRSAPLATTMKIIFEQFKAFFLLHFIALLLCDINLNSDTTIQLQPILETIIRQYLLIDENYTQLSYYVQFFIATIVLKRSWLFLMDLLKSDYIQNVNQTWANNLHRLIEPKPLVRSKKGLQLCHQLQFTVASQSDISSIFPKLHMFYDELSQIIENCVSSNTLEEQSKSLCDWIQTKLNSDPVQLKPDEIKAMLVLVIYYNYYSSNRLESIQFLLDIVNEILEPSPEELRVFRAMLKPEEYMIGYPINDNNEDINYLNKLFQLDCDELDELVIRHCLINLIAMILIGGKSSFLWKFVFEPLELQETFGKFLRSSNICFVLLIRFKQVSDQQRILALELMEFTMTVVVY